MPVPSTQAERHAWIRTSEALQRQAWSILSDAAPLDLRDRFGIQARKDGSELYQAARDIPGFSFNKVFSFGIDRPITAERVADARDWLTTRCAPGSMIAVPPLEQSVAAETLLVQGGLERHPLDVAILTLDDDVRLEPTPSADVAVRIVSLREAALFGRTVCEGFAVTPAAAGWLAALIGQPGMTAYLAVDGETAIGAAAMFCSGDWAWLFIGSTRPAFRNRGAQTALLTRRVQDGRAAGVRTFTVAAFSPAEGHDPKAFTSYRNIRRCGFSLGYDRPNYVLARPLSASG